MLLQGGQRKRGNQHIDRRRKQSIQNQSQVLGRKDRQKTHFQETLPRNKEQGDCSQKPHLPTPEPSSALEVQHRLIIVKPVIQHIITYLLEGMVTHSKEV